MDILRKMNFSDFRVGRNLNINRPEDEYMSGLFDRGFFAKSGNVLHKGLQTLDQHPTIKSKLLNMVPGLGRAIMSGIPVVKQFAPKAEEALQKLIDKRNANMNDGNMRS